MLHLIQLWRKTRSFLVKLIKRLLYYEHIVARLGEMTLPSTILYKSVGIERGSRKRSSILHRILQLATNDFTIIWSVQGTLNKNERVPLSWSR